MDKKTLAIVIGDSGIRLRLSGDWNYDKILK